MKRALIVSALFALIVDARSAAAQSGMRNVVFTTFYRSWQVDDGVSDGTTVSQFGLPTAATARLGERADVVLSLGAASSSVDNASANASLGGATALAARLYLKVSDRLLLDLGISPPSGVRELDDGEFAVAQALGLPLLGFDIRTYGHGLEGGAAVTYMAHRAARSLASIGVGGTWRGEYALRDDDQDYQPGSDWAMTAGLDLGAIEDGGGTVWDFDATWREFGEDRLAGDAVFEEGDQIELQAHVLTGGDGLRFESGARAILKDDNLTLAPPGAAVAQIQGHSGDGWVLRAGFNTPLPNRARAGLDAEWNRVTNSDAFTRNGYAWSIGPSYSTRLGERFGLRARLELLGGRLDGPPNGDPSDIHGWGVSARWSFAP